MSEVKEAVARKSPLLPFRLSVTLAGGLGLISVLLLSPSLIARLLSADGVFEAHTVWEIQAWRVATALVSCGLLLGRGLWRACGNMPLLRNIEHDFASWENPVNCREVAGTAVAGLAAAASGAMVVVVVLSFRFYEHLWFRALALESGVIETMQALFLCGAGMLLVRQAWRDYRSGGHPTTAVGILFGFALLLGAGEEISWGQHWIGFATPESIAAINVQGEFNLHNIGSYWLNHAQLLLLIVYGGVLPGVGYVYPQVHYVLDRMSLPIAPLAMLPVVFFSATLDEHEKIAQLWSRPPWRLSEGREFIFALCVFLMVLLMQRYRRNSVR